MFNRLATIKDLEIKLKNFDLVKTKLFYFSFQIINAVCRYVL